MTALITLGFAIGFLLGVLFTLHPATGPDSFDHRRRRELYLVVRAVTIAVILGTLLIVGLSVWATR